MTRLFYKIRPKGVLFYKIDVKSSHVEQAVRNWCLIIVLNLYLFRFEHREENRKDCLRTLYALLEESYKANQLVHDTRTSYVKERLRANPQFMERLRAKTLQKGASLPS